MQLLPPPKRLVLLPHPQPQLPEVKLLMIVCLHTRVLFMVYCMRLGMSVFPDFGRKMGIVYIKLMIQDVEKHLHKFLYIVK